MFGKQPLWYLQTLLAITQKQKFIKNTVILITGIDGNGKNSHFFFLFIKPPK
jgi:hypothetical protein